MIETDADHPRRCNRNSMSPPSSARRSRQANSPPSAALAREEFGLELGNGKEQLVAARLGKLMRRSASKLSAITTGMCRATGRAKR